MPSSVHPGPCAELEIKLALPAPNPAGLAQQLARLPALARRQPVHKQVDNIYYDTPAQVLRAQRMALRLRDDLASEPNNREANQKSAPAVERGLFLVPKVIE